MNTDHFPAASIPDLDANLRLPNRIGFSNPIWSVAGGKGGTGKSVITANLSLGMAIMGYEVVVIDGDLGAPNLHNCLNKKRPRYTLNDFIMGKVKNLQDIVLETPLKNLKFISGGTALLSMANLPHARKEKILRHINDLTADLILVDLGAGTTYNTLDFFNLSDQGIIVCNPEPNAKYDAFYFLKNAIFRRLTRFFPKATLFQQMMDDYLKNSGDNKLEITKFLLYLEKENPELLLEIESILKGFTPRLIMNKVRNREQIREGDWFVNLVKNYLMVEMEYCGHVEFDKKVMYASEQMIPFLFSYPKCDAAKCMYQLIERLNPRRRRTPINSFRRFRQELQNYSSVWSD